MKHYSFWNGIVCRYILAATLCGLLAAPLIASERSGHVKAASNKLALPVMFEQNTGQFPTRYDFVVRNAEAKIGINANGITFASPATHADSPALRLLWVGANTSAAGRGEDTTRSSTYYLSPAAEPQPPVPTFQRIAYRNLLPGVDLEYYGNHNRLEYDFILHPGQPVADIRLRAEGADRLELDQDGNLRIHRDGRYIVQRKPLVYQHQDEGRMEIASHYTLLADNEVGFSVAAYDATRPLVIDPVIEFATYFGASGSVTLHDVAVDAQKNTYLIGYTSAAKLPGEATPPVYIPGPEPNGMFISKIASDWNSVAFTSYLGGSIGSQITGYRMAVAPDNSIYFAYGTLSSLNALTVTRPIYGAGDAAPGATGIGRTMVGKIAANGGSLLWHTGVACGQGSLLLQDLVTDADGKAIVAARTNCPAFPTSAGAYVGNPNAHFSGGAGLVAFQPSGEEVAYALQFGGSAEDTPTHLTIAANGDLVVGGYTESTDFPTTQTATQSTLAGGRDIFLSRFSSDGSSLLASTYYGGIQTDNLEALSLDANGGVAAALFTQSPTLPGTAGTFQPERGAAQWAILRMPSSLDSVSWATYFPGMARFADIRVDAAGNVWILGSEGGAYPGAPITPSAILPLSEWAGGYLARLNSTGSVVTLGTALPGSTRLNNFARILNLEAGKVSILNSTLYVNLPPVSTQNTLTDWPNVDTRQAVYLMRVDTNNPTTCTYSISPPEQEVDWRGGTAEFTITAPAGCPWIVFAGSGLDNVTGPPQQFGTGTVQITEPANPDSYAERTQVYYLNDPYGPLSNQLIVKQPPASCAEPTLSAQSLAFDADGGVRNVTLRIPNGCRWNNAVSDVWVSTNLPSSMSDGEFSFWVSVPRNDFEPRQSQITIAGLTLPITQEGRGCTSTVTASGTAVPASGGTATIDVVSSASTCAWQASGTERVQFDGAVSNTGNGSFSAILGANPTNTPIHEFVSVAGKTIQLIQAAGECQVELHSNQNNFGSQGGMLNIYVVASGPSCAWYMDFDAPWITQTGSTGQGTGNFTAQIVPNNTGVRRSTTVMILGRAVTITQEGQDTVQIGVTTSYGGVPFQANGVTHYTHTSLTLIPGTQVTLTAPTEFLLPEKLLWIFRSWSIGEGTTVTYTVPDRSDSVKIHGDTYTGVRVRTQGAASGDGSGVSLSSTTPLFRTTGEWNYYDPIMPGGSLVGSVTITANPGPASRFSHWLYPDNSTSTTNPLVLSLSWAVDLRAVFEPIDGPGPVEEGASATPSNLSYNVYTGVTQTITNPVAVRKTGPSEIAFQAPVLHCGSGPAIPFVLTTSALTTPFNLAVQLNTSQITSLAVGRYEHCLVTLQPTSSAIDTIQIPIVLNITNPSSETPMISALVDAASYQAGSMAIGSIATIFGTNLAPTVANADTLPLPTEFQGTRLVLHREGAEHNCEIFYVSPTQINFKLPDGFPLGPALLTLYRNGVQHNSASLNIVEVRPSIFTANSDGSGAPAGHYVRVRDGAQTVGNLFQCVAGGGTCSPAILESGGPGDEDFYLVLFGTGIRYRTEQARVMINGIEAPVLYSGPQHEFVGLDQINIQVPRELIGTGIHEVIVQVSGRSANTVSVHF